MKHLLRISILAAVCILGVSFLMPAQAASKKKTAYVRTWEQNVDLSAGYSETYKMSYKKSGLLSSAKWSDSDRKSRKGKYSYNSKKRAKKQTYKYYVRGKKKSSGMVKFACNKSGYLSSARSFRKTKGKYRLYNVKTFAWDTPGNYTIEVENDLDAKDRHVWYWGHYENGNYSGLRYFKNATLYKKSAVNYPSRWRGVEKTYIFSDVTYLFDTVETTYHTFDSHGNIVSSVTYDENGNKIRYSTYKYKKVRVKTKDYNKVLCQQKGLWAFL